MDDFLAGISLLEVVAAVTAVAALVAFLRKFWPWFSRFKDFLDDLMGEPARPGVPERPGVMARLEAHETEIVSIRVLAESAEYHSKPNGGGSAYDHLMKELRGLRGDFDIHLSQAQRRDERLDGLDKALANLSEALPVVARSVPHPQDAHLPID